MPLLRSFLVAVFGVFSTVGVVTPFGVDAVHARQDQSPSVNCASPDLFIEMGSGGVPLPIDYSNPTDDTITISAKMNANRFFGPAHDLGDIRTLPPNIGQHLTATPVIPVTTGMPWGFDTIVIDYFVDDKRIAHCAYQVTVQPGADLADLIHVNILWCVLAGSPQAEGLDPGDIASGEKLFQLTQGANDRAWAPGARIAFWPWVTETFRGVPVIADPDTSSGQEGVIDAPGGDPFEARQAAAACRAWWDDHEPLLKGVGVVAVNAKAFDNAGLMLGASEPPDKGYYVVGSEAAFSGEHGDDLCGFPRHLTEEAVVGEEDEGRLWVVVKDQRSMALDGDGSVEVAMHTLAHELGHTLWLGHGNGFDDNHDGLEPPIPGIRRYDEYCDPLWLVAPTFTGNPEEDLLTTPPNPDEPCEVASLMQASGCQITFTVRSLQAETARDVAGWIPVFNPVA